MAVPKPLKQVLDEVVSAASSDSEVGAFARQLRPLLESAIEELSSTAVTRPSRRGTGEVSYVVEKTQQGEVLTENRPGRNSKPFRCPKLVYEVLADILAGALRPLALDEIMATAEATTGDRPADHQVRVAIRFWMHVKPPLISRNRARYKGISMPDIQAAARNLWRHLKGEEDR